MTDSKSGHQKGADTMRRRKEEERAERLRHIRKQTADGSLVIRQMTVAQHQAASEVAAARLARNKASTKGPKAR